MKRRALGIDGADSVPSHARCVHNEKPNSVTMSCFYIEANYRPDYRSVVLNCLLELGGG